MYKIYSIENINVLKQIAGVEQYAVRAFADALEQIPTVLADNSGLWPIEAVADVKASQIKTGNPRIGVDCKIFVRYKQIYCVLKGIFRVKLI